jgi:2-phospho-L-lactate guanylyltransferase
LPVPAAAILPVKRLGAAKQRLSGAVGADERAALAAAMLADVLAALERASTVGVIVLVSGDPAAAAHADPARGIELVHDEGDQGQSRAALAGMARAVELGCDTALLVPGDCPLIDPAEIDQLVAEVQGRVQDVLVVPDRHGAGTNALALDPAGPFEPQFGPGSLERHVRQAELTGLRCAVREAGSLALDLDTPDDLDELLAALQRSPGAEHTRAMLAARQGKRAARPAA